VDRRGERPGRELPTARARRPRGEFPAPPAASTSRPRRERSESRPDRESTSADTLPDDEPVWRDPELASAGSGRRPEAADDDEDAEDVVADFDDEDAEDAELGAVDEDTEDAEAAAPQPGEPSELPFVSGRPDRDRRGATGRLRDRSAREPHDTRLAVLPGAGGHARLLLKPHQDRRVRSGHPWVFSNEIGTLEGEPADGAIVDVCDARGAFLGRGYFNHRSLIAARLLTRRRDEIDVDFFVKRFERAKKLRESVLPGVEALRLVSSEGDQLPGLVIDRYGDVLAVQILTLGMEVRADEIREAIEKVFAPKGAWRLADAPLRRLEGLTLEREPWWGDAPDQVEVEIEGFRVEANLASGQKTGLFLDQRLNRRRAEQRAKGRRVLDLFAYQGEWALHVLRGGAASVLAVDSSEPALEALRRNMVRNGLEHRTTPRRGDVFDVLREIEKSGERYGMVIVDPPALIKSGKALAAGVRAYREINRAAMSLLEEDGVLVTCSCSHHLDDALFRQVLLESARAAKRPFRVLEWAGESPDHPQLLAVPETHYLKCAVLQAL